MHTVNPIRATSATSLSKIALPMILIIAILTV